MITRECDNCGIENFHHGEDCVICHYKLPEFPDPSNPDMPGPHVAIDPARLPGEIVFVLKHGSEEHKESLLTAIELTAGIVERLRIEEWINEGMPGA